MNFHVYGIGNALVDAEFEVNNEFLQDNNIEKGLMTLIDEDQQEKLFNNLTNKFGLKKRAGGGSAANSMVAISQLGGNSFYACKVADDESGDFYIKDLAIAGVTTKLDLAKGKGVTGKCIVMVTDDAERTMNTYLGITSDFSRTDLHIEELKNSEYIYIEGYLVTSEVSKDAVLHAREIAAENNVKTAFTFSDPAMVTYFKEGISEIIGNGVDVLFCNEEEACTYSSKENINAAIADLSKIAHKIIITMGDKGAKVITGETIIDIEAHPVTAIDTNGAGDMFAGAFMYGLTQKMTDEKSGRLASKAASEIVSTFGARLDKETLQKML